MLLRSRARANYGPTFLLLLFAICSSFVTAARQDKSLIKDYVTIPKFTLAPFRPPVITIPAFPQIPPFLRNFVVTVKEVTSTTGTLTAVSPILATNGTGTYKFAKDGTLFAKIKFAVPDIQVTFTAVNCDRLVCVTGRAVHTFRRPLGVRLIRSARSQVEGVRAVHLALAELSGKPNSPRLIATVDHTSVAQQFGLSLAPSTVVVFGNPVIGFPLWNRRQEVGVEIPGELLVAESPLGLVYVAYNTPAWIRKRFGLFGLEPMLRKLDGALAKFASSATNLNIKPAGLAFDSSRPQSGGGFLEEFQVITTMNGDAPAVFNRLVCAVEANPTVVFGYKVLHDKAAAAAGFNTQGKITRVAVFRNAVVATTFIKNSFTIALDLPVKVLVWSAPAVPRRVNAGFNGVDWLVRRHGFTVPEGTDSLLRGLVNTALNGKGPGSC